MAQLAPALSMKRFANTVTHSLSYRNTEKIQLFFAVESVWHLMPEFNLHRAAKSAMLNLHTLQVEQTKLNTVLQSAITKQ